MTEIKYHRDVLLFLDELTDILIEKEYFSFYEYSAQYIEDLVNYVKNNITIKPHFLLIFFNTTTLVEKD
ncbi:MAG: hypothetical protein FWD60_03020 [Candidatus Azobacteroides sp.]|nr:hypothetical protein [Candidatus Azobacteroides sp.]